MNFIELSGMGSFSLQELIYSSYLSSVSSFFSFIFNYLLRSIQIFLFTESLISSIVGLN